MGFLGLLLGCGITIIESMAWAVNTKRIYTSFKEEFSVVDVTVPKKTFADIRGYENIKKKLKNLIYMTKNKKKLKKYGRVVPKNILLHGPPGTGKSVMAEAYASKLNYKFIKLNSTKFVQTYVGQGKNMLAQVFKDARAFAPSVVFIDELDAIAKNRSQTVGHSHANADDVLVQLMLEMSSPENKDVHIISATNNLSVIDAALVRSNRFDTKIKVDLPEAIDIEKIMNFYINKLDNYISPEFVKEISRIIEGRASGADVEYIIKSAGEFASIQNLRFITSDHIFDALLEYYMGPLKESKVDLKCMENTAIHEAGHAVISWYWNYKKPSLISIGWREGMLGVCFFTNTAEHVESPTRASVFASIMTALGGKAAEESLSNICTIGPTADINDATKLVRHMYQDCGMIGGIAKKSKVNTKMEEAVLKRCYDLTKIIIENYKNAIKEIAEYLVNKNNNMSHEEFLHIMNKYPRVDLMHKLPPKENTDPKLEFVFDPVFNPISDENKDESEEEENLEYVNLDEKTAELN
ncbi:MAG: ATP-dependent zinc metalloprotease FtsH [Candidatus Improbicoccus devescovinae]|nr:MAG: ATP-dependent zinc metalloprotease FtsH [Candidatus Improbicoccus devescovinae]